jgi:hypothetical protein
VHGIIEDIKVGKDDKILSMVNIGDITKKGDIILRKTIGEIDQLIGFDFQIDAYLNFNMNF